MFPKIGVPQNGWFTMENPIKMDDLGVFPIFLETPTWSYFTLLITGDFGRPPCQTILPAIPNLHLTKPKAVAIHSTSYVNVKGNVAFDIIGHMSGTQLARFFFLGTLSVRIFLIYGS